MALNEKDEEIGNYQNSVNEKEKGDLEKFNKHIQSIIPKILSEQGFEMNWKGVEGVCEWCGIRRATVNLDLKAGTHRECRQCWDD